jgi:hypothetical protein
VLSKVVAAKRSRFVNRHLFAGFAPGAFGMTIEPRTVDAIE